MEREYSEKRMTLSFSTLIISHAPYIIHNGKTTDGIISSEYIQTRSKKGVTKSNPKYVSLS